MNKPISLETRKPKWLKTKIPTGETYFKIKKSLRESKLHTVCEEAKCPNIGECWNNKTATFMIMGDTCTRACRFCHIKTASKPPELDQNEPQAVASNCLKMGLEYVVLTMVNRDDMPDGGSKHIFDVISKIKFEMPEIKVELLAGDFQNNQSSILQVLETQLVVFAHNIETIERLTPRVRDARASYIQSLEVLQFVKEKRPELVTKSSIMIGLGESEEEIIKTIEDLKKAGVDMITIGQYMRPTPKHLSVKKWYSPEEFKTLEKKALELGIKGVVSGPLVRSSYKANEFYEKTFG